MSGVLLRDGLRLALHDTGGDGIPVVLQHGLGGAASQILDYAGGRPALRIITLDCRGHGDSEIRRPADIAIATFADDVAAAIEAVGRGPLIVGGVSMGAAIGLRLAVRRPDLVRALVLVRPAWVVEAGPESMAPNAEVGALLARHPAAEGRRLFLEGAIGRRLAVEAPDNLASLLGFFDHAASPVTADLLTRISADGPGVSEAEVRALRVPTLVIGNARDAVHPLAFAERLSALIPGAALRIVTPKADDKPRHLAEAGDAIEAFVTAHSHGNPS